MANPNPLDGRTGAPPVPGLSANEAERILAPLIQSWERVMLAQGAQFQAMSNRIEQMAGALDADRKQNVEVLQQAQASMEVATKLIEQADDQVDKLVEVTLALSAVFDVAQEGQPEGEEGQ